MIDCSYYSYVRYMSTDFSGSLRGKAMNCNKGSNKLENKSKQCSMSSKIDVPEDTEVLNDQVVPAILISFSSLEEMQKACKILSDISCTIMSQSTLDIHTVSSPQLEECTKREYEVLNMLAKGYRYSEIAVSLHCKISTVQTHVKNLYSKLEVHSRSEAVYEAMCLGLIKI